jgi:hypothetical protein
LLEVFNAKVGRGDIFNPTVGKKILNNTSNDTEDHSNKVYRKQSTVCFHITTFINTTGLISMVRHAWENQVLIDILTKDLIT